MDVIKLNVKQYKKLYFWCIFTGVYLGFFSTGVLYHTCVQSNSYKFYCWCFNSSSYSVHTAKLWEICTAPGDKMSKYAQYKQLRWTNFNSHYLVAKQSFSIVEKITKHYEKKAIITLTLFPCSLQLTLECGKCILEVRVSAEAQRRRSRKKIKETERNIGFREVYRCRGELVAQWAASVGFQKHCVPLVWAEKQ